MDKDIKRINAMLRYCSVMATAILLILVMAMASESADNEGLVIGKSYKTTALCLDRKSTMGLTAAITLGGYPAYLAYLDSKTNECYSSKTLTGPVITTTVKVLEKVWKAVGPNGAVIQFYKVQSPKGNVGYSWARVS